LSESKPSWDDENKLRAQGALDSVIAMGKRLYDAREAEDDDEIERAETEIREDVLEVTFFWKGTDKESAEFCKVELLLGFGGPNIRLVADAAKHDDVGDADGAFLDFHWSGHVRVNVQYEDVKHVQAYLDCFAYFG